MDKATQLDHYKYSLYEASVQFPKEDACAYRDYFKLATGRRAFSLREDFCGTFAFSVEWVKLSPKNTAIALDIDKKPLGYGFQNHYPKLNEGQKKRLLVLEKNVISKTSPPVDLTVANNFSFYIFHQEETLLKYFQAVYKSIKKGGAFIIEMVGGPNFIESGTETRKVRKKGLHFTYYWEQQNFNPITSCGRWAIHFKEKNRRKMSDAFIYDWRLWSIAEVRYFLKKAGFSDSIVLWESKSSNNDYKKTNYGENFECWISYIAGVK